MSTRQSAGQAGSRGWGVVWPELMDMTSASDGRTHTITAAEFEHGVLQGRGRYRAVCGAGVLVAPMTSDPGPRCSRCGEVRRQNERAATVPGLLARLAHMARGLLPGG